MLAAELGLDEREDVFETDGMMQMRDLMELASIDDPALHDPPHHPIDHPRLPAHRNIFHSIRDAGSILLMHPYESFSTSVARFLREASEDPKVRAIKMTLYRTSSDAEIIGYLCDAARNGKQVAVVVELKARFDEAANIQFAEQLEDFGIHVTYGVVGLKTHCKVILVVRQDYNGLRRYAHIGTGNYHPGTARLYADYGLLTCDEVIGQDLTELFNYLTTGYAPGRIYKKILPAPTFLKQALIAKIDREIKLHSDSVTRPHPAQVQRARRRRCDARALSRLDGGGEDRSHRARHLPPASRPSRIFGNRARGQHRRALPRTRAHLLFPQRRRRGVLHRLGRPDEAQPRKPGRGDRAGRGSRAAQGAARDPRLPARARTNAPGTCNPTALTFAIRRATRTARII